MRLQPTHHSALKNCSKFKVEFFSYVGQLSLEVIPLDGSKDLR